MEQKKSTSYVVLTNVNRKTEKQQKYIAWKNISSIKFSYFCLIVLTLFVQRYNIEALSFITARGGFNGVHDDSRGCRIMGYIAKKDSNIVHREAA